jgi:hypothetical protein
VAGAGVRAAGAGVAGAARGVSATASGGFVIVQQFVRPSSET